MERRAITLNDSLKRKYWEIPRALVQRPLLRGALRKYGRLYITQPYREQEKWRPWHGQACDWSRCQCSCNGGQFHGAAGNDW